MNKHNFKKIDLIAQQALSEISDNSNSKEIFYGLKSGFEDLDKITYGWEKGELIIISGRPSMGKTSFMLSMIINMSIEGEIPVAVFSLESTTSKFMMRLLSTYCEIEGSQLQSGSLTDEEWSELDNKLKNIIDANIYLDCPARINIQDLCKKAKSVVENNGVKALFIDYVQLITVSEKYTENRYNEMNFISRELKALAKELNIPVFVISQMNRNSETNKERGLYDGKRPRLTDLRDSGTLCDDADKVCFIYRPEYYRITEDSEGNSLLGIAELILAKNRNGWTNDVRLKYKKEYSKFYNLPKKKDNNNDFGNFLIED